MSLPPGVGILYHVLARSAGGPGNLTVTRANGMTFTWNPNGSTGHVELLLDSGTAPPVQAFCTAPASAGTFTIPSYVLLALPAGKMTGFAFQPGSQGPASSAAFSATGLDAGIVFASNESRAGRS